MNLPNLLSLLRILLMPFILWALKQERQVPLLLLMAAAVATDFLDGFWARRQGQVTEWGKVLDPLADKICIDSMALALWLWRGFPGWAAAAIIGRDLLILGGGLWLRWRTKATPVSNWPGKAAATVMAGTIIAYAMGWQPLGYYLLFPSLASVFLSGAIYLRFFIHEQRGG